jgi:hypothetical protein
VPVAVIAVISALVLAACGSGEGTGEHIVARDVAAGTAATTASGGRLTVGSVDRLGPADEHFHYVAVDVTACAPRSDVRTRVDPAVFGLETDDARMVRGAAIAEPALRDAVIAPGACRDGRVTFVIRDGQRPRSVVYLGASRIRWLLARGAS